MGFGLVKKKAWGVGCVVVLVLVVFVWLMGCGCCLVSICTILFAAWPLPKGFFHLGLGCSILCVLERMVLGFVPARVLAPTSKVSGRSVLYLNVTHGTPKMHASSWTPPESVRMSLALFSSCRKLR